MKFFIIGLLGLFLAITPAHAADCPENVDPVYCQASKETPELQSIMPDFLEDIGHKPALLLFALAPLSPLLMMLIIVRRPTPSKVNHALFALGCMGIPLLIIIGLRALTEETSLLDMTAFTIGNALLLITFILTGAFSLIANHNKPTLWAGALILSSLTAFGIYQLLYQGIG